MLWKDTLKLLTITESTNSNGFPEQAQTEKEVYCNVKSVKRSEFYQAQLNNIALAFVFEVSAHDYADEKNLIYNEKRYRITRTFQKNTEVLELVVSDSAEVLK
jgi:SPP1 family predicted phage head-tail adaptor